MEVIYIAGASHSGSTLLAMMLNAHSEIVSVGELLKLNMKLQGAAPCSCGAPSFGQCEFWRRVNEHARSKVNKTLKELNVLDYARLDEDSAPNAIVLRAISEVSAKKFVVDASKKPDRLSYLLKLPGLDVHPIVLIRDPKGQVCSVKKKHGGFLGPILRYEYVYEQLRHLLERVPHSFVIYEDLVAHPEHVLRRILKPLGLDFEPQQLSWGQEANHFVGGNRLRRLRPTNSELVLDERWKRDLTRIQRTVIDLLTVRSRQFRESYRNSPSSSFVAND